MFYPLLYRSVYDSIKVFWVPQDKISLLLREIAGQEDTISLRLHPNTRSDNLFGQRREREGPNELHKNTGQGSSEPCKFKPNGDLQSQGRPKSQQYQ